MNPPNFKKIVIQLGPSFSIHESYHLETTLNDVFTDIYEKYYSVLGNSIDFLPVVKMKSIDKPPKFYKLSENSTKTIRQVYRDLYLESFLFPAPNGHFFLPFILLIQIF